jgi:hypothetical protein
MSTVSRVFRAAVLGGLFMIVLLAILWAVAFAPLLPMFAVAFLFGWIFTSD